ncbi:HTH-type transcriptional repressor AcnR [Marinibacterium anthonyi]|nr:HTH-type transcriptional repressor AcnR [Marinibacterium anthonyi]
MGDTTSVVRTGRKFDQVLAGAREVFMADGFEGASVDDIAKAAGVSKATLYSYFPDKRLLFMEVAKHECHRMAEETEARIDSTKPVPEVLTLAAVEIVTFLTSAFGQQIHRICVAEAERFPELGRAFYENGPERGRERLAVYLRKMVSAGEMVIEDVPLAAEQFSELCKCRLWTRAVFGVQTDFTRDEIRFVATEAVKTFLARYGACKA